MEELDAPFQGSIMHRFLELGFSLADPHDPDKRIAFSPKLDSEFFSQSPEQIKSQLQSLMLEEIPGIDLSSGPNLLHLESMTLMLHRFLRSEKQRISKLGESWSVLANEADLEGWVELESGQEIKIHGQADRIDAEADAIHIIDYKTGVKGSEKYRLSELSFEALLKKPDAIQLPIYALMYLQKKPTKAVKASILSLRKIRQGAIKMNLAGQEQMQGENAGDFIGVLRSIFEEMFDPLIPFQERS